MPGLIWTTKYLFRFKELWKKLYGKTRSFSIGLLQIGAILSCNNATMFTFTNLLLNPDQSLFVMSIIDSIPAQWRTIVKGSSSLPIIPPVPDNPPLSLSMKFLRLFLISLLNKFTASCRRSRDCLLLKRNCLKSNHTPS